MIKWPNNKKFAFTIIDDTDFGTLDNIKPVYDYLISRGLRTTKTIWVYPPRDQYEGDSLVNEKYKEYMIKLNNLGFEIAFHSVGSGEFSREEILNGMKEFEACFGYYPYTHINHDSNPDSIYWGEERFSKVFVPIYKYLKNRKNQITSFQGSKKGSKYFWGDECKKHIKYTRNMVFSGINTLNYDKRFPYIEKSKNEYSNYWFSSSYGNGKGNFVSLLSNDNIDMLEKEGGCCIVYTHFAYGFVDENGELSQEFKDCIDYLVSKDGWFVPAHQILDFLKTEKGRGASLSFIDSLIMNIKWFKERGFQVRKD